MKWRDEVKGKRATTEEWAAIHTLRLAALSAATQQVTGGEPLPVEEREGWTSSVRNVGRGYDGCLRVVVTVRDPENAVRLRRKVRLYNDEEWTTG